MATNRDYYEILGIDKSATKDEIKRAYFKMSKKYHPDVNKEPDAQEKFLEVSEAYQCLYDDDKRKAYDSGSYNPNASYQYDDKPKNTKYDKQYNTFDPTWINEYVMDGKPFDDFVKALKKLSPEQQVFTYEYFWLSFWIGGTFCRKLFENNLLSKMFEAFASIIFLKHKEVFNEQFSERAEDMYLSTTRRLIELIKNSNTKRPERAYNKMVMAVKSENIYDLSYISLIAADKKQETIEMFQLFETTYKAAENCGALIQDDKSLVFKRNKMTIYPIIGLVVLFILIMILIFV